MCFAISSTGSNACSARAEELPGTAGDQGVNVVWNSATLYGENDDSV
jgi:hypothetical protein